MKKGKKKNFKKIAEREDFYTRARWR
jgi:hypothetical protein